MFDPAIIGTPAAIKKMNTHKARRKVSSTKTLMKKFGTMVKRTKTKDPRYNIDEEISDYNEKTNEDDYIDYP